MHSDSKVAAIGSVDSSVLELGARLTGGQISNEKSALASRCRCAVCEEQIPAGG
jgi:hypothetical protein